MSHSSPNYDSMIPEQLVQTTLCSSPSVIKLTSQTMSHKVRIPRFYSLVSHENLPCGKKNPESFANESNRKHRALPWRFHSSLWVMRIGLAEKAGPFPTILP